MDSDIARRRIEDFVHDCAHCIDDDRLEEWPSYFTADCRYAIIDRDSYAKGMPVGFWTSESRGMLEDRVLSLREANVYEPHCYRHLISGIRIRGEAGGVYEVESSYAVIRTMQDGEVTVFSSGKYLDKVVFEDGAPRFAQRIVVCDSGRVDTRIVIPI